MEDDAIDIIGALNQIQPTTQQVDYSGFMQDFQPVLNNPNYFVPQQGLLQNTPVLDTLSDLDVMQQRPQVVMDMLDQYPTLESDFQQSFAVSPDTFNMNVYKPLPYDPSFWESFINRGGTLDGSLDLGGLGAAGLVGASAYKLLSGDDTTKNGTNTTGTDIIRTINTGGSDAGGSTSTDTTEIIKSIDTDDSTDSSTGTDTKELTTIDNTSLLSNIESDESQTTGNTEETSGYITKDYATNIIKTLVDTNKITTNDADSLINTIEKTDAAFGPALLSGLSSIAGNSVAASNLIGEAETILRGTSSLPTGVASSTFVPTGETGGLNVGGTIDASINLGDTGIPNSAMGVDPFGNITFENDKGIFIQKADGSFAQQTKDKFGNLTYVDIDGDPRGLFDRIGSGISEFLTNPINEGFGTAGSAINDATSFTGAEALSLAGGILSGLDAIEDGNISNVFNTAAGLGGSGLLGSQAQALATNPATAAIGTLLFVANQMAPDPSAKTGSGTYDYDTNTASEFGMGGDKFKQEHVDAASSISQGIGTAVNTIANAYGLSVEGDHLVEFGRDRPLSITFGDTDEEQTNTDRLNYSPETGDIINSTDDIKRFYFLNDGNTSTRVTDNVVKGTNLLALKAIANNEDSINLKDFVLPARSSDDVMRGYMSLGYDEVAADALTGASQNPSPDAASLLGSLLQPNTVDTRLFLTDAERTSLLDKGYTNEQLDTLLYGTTQDSVAAINLLNIDEENNQTNT